MAIAMLSRSSKPGMPGATTAVLVALCIIIAAAAAAPRAVAAAAPSLPSLTKACHDVLSIKGTRDILNTCKDRAPATLVQACDKLARAPPATVDDALANAFTALNDGRAGTVPTADADAACALASVHRAHTAVCNAARGPSAAFPDALANACAASRASLFDNDSFVLGDATATPSLPSLAKACDTLATKGTRDVFNACKELGRKPETLVVACEEVVRAPAATAGAALANAFTALADGRANAVPARDVDAACALGTVHRAFTAACEAPRGSLAAAPNALAAGCKAARATLLGNASAAVGGVVPGTATTRS